jgi:hypothetical protein
MKWKISSRANAISLLSPEIELDKNDIRISEPGDFAVKYKREGKKCTGKFETNTWQCS